MSGVALLFILLIGLMMASVPVGISLGLSTLVTMVLTTNLDVITIPQYCFRGLDSFPLMAIPFFMLAGNLMKFGGLSEKLINLSNSPGLQGRPWPRDGSGLHVLRGPVRLSPRHRHGHRLQRHSPDGEARL